MGPRGFYVSRDPVCSVLCDLYRKKVRLPMEDIKALRSYKQGHFGCSVCIGIHLIIAILFPLSVKLRINPATLCPDTYCSLQSGLKSTVAQNFDPLRKSIQEQTPSIYDPFPEPVILGSTHVSRNVLD